MRKLLPLWFLSGISHDQYLSFTILVIKIIIMYINTMALNITSVTNHRGREKGNIVYPVYSRRSAGLSVGINLFPDKKKCSFDCPYCEVFPFSGNAEFSIEQMENDLRVTIDAARGEWIAAHDQNTPVKDICFSGNGEPSLSPAFNDALKLAGKIRAELAASAELVLITNGAGLLTPRIFSLLQDAANGQLALNIWLKLDAGTIDWYQKMNRANIPFEKLISKIKDFTACAPVTLQTMLCAINSKKPPVEEAQEWEKLVCETAAGGNIRKVQIYGKARPAPEDPLASPLPASYLEERAASLRGAFEEKGITAPVEIYL